MTFTSGQTEKCGAASNQFWPKSLSSNKRGNTQQSAYAICYYATLMDVLAPSSQRNSFFCGCYFGRIRNKLLGQRGHYITWLRKPSVAAAVTGQLLWLPSKTVSSVSSDDQFSIKQNLNF